MSIEASLRQHVQHAAGRTLDPSCPVQKLKGDASNRSYYRVGRPPESWVVMVMPKDAAKASEEATNGAAPSELPFIDVQRYLRRLGVRVPEILAYDEQAGVMVLEDLSDVTFEAALGGQVNDAGLYGRAVDLLATLRARSEATPEPSCVAFRRSFDEALYDWELHHFREWGLEIWSGRKPEGAERRRLDELFREVASRLASVPRGFTHRDYQSRNLMVKADELVVIDFQDALLGPRQYDLVALLRDSYVELEQPFVDQMVERYLATFERERGECVDRRDFKETFELLTIQRKLKDAGRFEFIHRVKGNPGFLPAIPASLRYVRQAFARRPELAELHALLASYVPELR